MILGIDAGSKFIKVTSVSDNTVRHIDYREHHGDPAGAASTLLAEIPNAPAIACTGLFGGHIAERFPRAVQVDEVSCIIAALRHLEARAHAVLAVGAASVKLITLDGEGRFASYAENSLCAAGTGSFLDQQMKRMGFSYDDIGALPFVPDPPEIATRCAVFAKSDLIHRQQEGHSRAALWSGLCRGVVMTMLHAAPRLDDEAVLMCGGLFLNPAVRRFTEELLEGARFIDEGHFLAALGAAIQLRDGGGRHRPVGARGVARAEGARYAGSLSLARSRPAASTAIREYADDGNEIRMHAPVVDGGSALLGIDIGSTSTKCALLDASTRTVLVDIYRKTGADPIDAARRLFRALESALAGTDLRIVAAGTTGSGRRLIGEIIGAEVIVNEITAHFRGATHFQPDVETIFEIGGQDAKYIRGHNGSVIDAAMNYVCAAGTGSFIEEQAERLGFDVRTLGELVLGLSTPNTSDRCTVFMEQDIAQLLRNGYSREEAMAGVIRSIAKNYLNRVVGARPVSGERIFFQGATARNRGLVAAFESLTGKEIVVSPYCHVMGAFGAALIAGDRTGAGVGTFRGRGVFEREIATSHETCDRCANYCRITVARVEGSAVASWGYRCGKEADDPAPAARRTDHFARVARLGTSCDAANGGARVVETRRPVAAIPEALSMHTYLPLWRTFLHELGFETVVEGGGGAELKEAAAQVTDADYCYPVKVALARFGRCAERDDAEYVFFPSVMSETRQDNGKPRVFCPYVISYPSLARSLFGGRREIIAPAIDFRFGDDHVIDELYDAFRDHADDRAAVARAFAAGRATQSRFLRERYEYGQRVMREAAAGGATAIVMIGRPYNLYDGIINLGLPGRFHGRGVTAIPYECLIDPDDNSAPVEHVYWNYGQRILSAAKMVRELPNAYAVYVTNFGCGPDSFILGRFEKLMRGKPYLIIELDEHGSETGYLTRIEAFMDVIAEARVAPARPASENLDFHYLARQRERTVWIPQMHEVIARLFAAGFRAWNFRSEALPLEDADAFETGLKNVRGSECLPAVATIGAFLKHLRDIDAAPAEHALFMPTADGPCRFGQYCVLHRAVLDANGFAEAGLFSPTSINSYMGMPDALRRYLWDVTLAGDLVYKMICARRPYEMTPGSVDARAEEAMGSMERVIEARGDVLGCLGRALESIASVPVAYEARPLVGIVGEIYVRCNPFCNDSLVRTIERCGGEAWLSPVSEWIAYTQYMERHLARLNGAGPLGRLFVGLKARYMLGRLHRFETFAAPYLPERTEPPVEEVLGIGKAHLPIIFEGEAILTLGRTEVFLRDGAAMVINCAPFGCMPGNITKTLFAPVQERHGKPVITLFYDGVSDVNRTVGIYLENLRGGMRVDEIEALEKRA